MMRRGSGVRSAWQSAMGVLLCAMTLGTSVTTPLLERDAYSGATTVESEHDLSTCSPKHDHRICAQVSANLALAAGAQGHHVAHVLVQLVAPAALPFRDTKPLLEGPPSRAPPLV
jgi:hypothetical protein